MNSRESAFYWQAEKMMLETALYQLCYFSYKTIVDVDHSPWKFLVEKPNTYKNRKFDLSYFKESDY